jgi:hypothetical protein
VRRSLGLAAMAVSFAVGIALSHGCVDERARVASAVFLCNAASRTADADCGAGFTCYTAAQALGSSMCVPRCDPANPKSCNGVCTASGACLTRCKVPGPGESDPCQAPLVCFRTTISKLEAGNSPDGVCMPVNSTCSSNADCRGSQIFDGCGSEVTGATQGPPGSLLTTGEVCLQSKCSADGVACEPGSRCIKDILPATIPAPDVCSPSCTSIRDRPDGGVAFNECPPSLTCLSDAFPETSAPACAPGFPGWICVDDLGCTTEACADWGDVDPALARFLTCSPRCNTDDDCVPFDRGGNPNVITRFTCHHTPDGDSWCRNLQSLFFPMTCLRNGDHCALDPAATCVAVKTAPSIPDMAGQPQACSNVPNSGNQGLGAFGGSAGGCVRACSSKADCQPFAAAAHVAMTCDPVTSACTPVVPFVSNCGSDDDCMSDLHCIDLGARKTCTKTCMSSDDCGKDLALGTTFTCLQMDPTMPPLCVPKTESGCTTGNADLCVSGKIDINGKCISPSGWACDEDGQCSSGKCNVIAGTVPAFGRCQ